MTQAQLANTVRRANAMANYLRMREATKATTKTPRPTRVRGSQYPIATPVRK